jgi:hypothetical protein
MDPRDGTIGISSVDQGTADPDPPIESATADVHDPTPPAQPPEEGHL